MARLVGTRTADPSIYSADGHELKLGATVYGVDVSCRDDDDKDRVPEVESLTVIQLDLGVRRQVRLRRQKGTEWTWSADERPGTCKSDRHYIYVKKASAVAAAKKAAAAHLLELNEKVREAQDELNKDRTYELRELNKAKKAAAAFKGKMRGRK